MSTKVVRETAGASPNRLSTSYFNYRVMQHREFRGGIEFLHSTQGATKDPLPIASCDLDVTRKTVNCHTSGII